MASDYLVQIVHKDKGKVVSFAPGLNVEFDIENELANRVAAKGVGVGRSSAHVVADVRAAFRELMHDLKAQVH